MIDEFKKSHNAVPLQPQLNYWELGATKSVQGKIPRYAASEQMNTIEMRSALGRIQDMEEDGAYMAREDQIRAAQTLQSIQSGIPISHLQAASRMIEPGLPDAVRENAESIQRASQADAQRRAMADAAVTASMMRSEEAQRNLVRINYASRLAPTIDEVMRGSTATSDRTVIAPPPAAPHHIPPTSTLVPPVPGMTAGSIIDLIPRAGGVLQQYARGARGFAGRSGGSFADVFVDQDPEGVGMSGLGMIGGAGAVASLGAGATPMLLAGLAGGLWGSVGHEVMRRNRSGRSGGPPPLPPQEPLQEPTNVHMRGEPHASMMGRLGPLTSTMPRINITPTPQLPPEESERFARVYTFYIERGYTEEQAKAAAEEYLLAGTVPFQSTRRSGSSGGQRQLGDAPGQVLMLGPRGEMPISAVRYGASPFAKGAPKGPPAKPPPSVLGKAVPFPEDAPVPGKGVGGMPRAPRPKLTMAPRSGRSGG